jgi:hypothetical protein
MRSDFDKDDLSKGMKLTLPKLAENPVPKSLS